MATRIRKRPSSRIHTNWYDTPALILFLPTVSTQRQALELKSNNNTQYLNLDLHPKQKYHWSTELQAEVT